jgi:hypothetical protein
LPPAGFASADELQQHADDARARRGTKDAGIGFRQKITQKVSPDGGLTWPSSKIYPAARRDDSFRPGMPVVLRLKNGQYFLVFEAGGSDNFLQQRSWQNVGHE